MKHKINQSLLIVLLLVIAFAISGCDKDKNPMDSNEDMNGYIFAGTDNGVFRSADNGNTWTQINSGLPETNVYILAINSDGYIFAGTDAQGVFRSTSNGDSWTQKSNGLPGFPDGVKQEIGSFAINSNGHIFAGTDDQGIFRSVDNGDSWTEINTGLPGNGEIRVRSIVINASEHIFVGMPAGVFRSTDNGNNWTQTGYANDVDRLAFNTSGHLFVGTELNGVFRSTDNGNQWTEINNGFPFLDLGILSFAFNSSGDIFTGVIGAIFRSTDNGDNWTMLNNSPNTYVFSLVINPNGHIFAGTGVLDGGVFRSTDNGDNWTQIGLTNSFVFSLVINSN